MISQCPNRGELTWLTEKVATCRCHPRNVWRRHKNGRRLVGVWEPSARELADLVERMTSG